MINQPNILEEKEINFVCPDVAVEWIKLRRNNKWTPHALFQEIVEYGGSLIPVGAKQTPTENLVR